MTRTVLDLCRISAKALKLEVIDQLGTLRFPNTQFQVSEWNPAEDEAQSAMCLDWLIANVQAVQFDSGEMTVAIPMRWNKYYPCRTPAERRMAVLMAVADVEEANK